MKRILTALVIGLSLAMGTVSGAFAQDYKKGAEAYKKGDFATALREWRPLAEKGDAGAQLMLGLMYGEGKGVIQDYKEAVKWFRLAVEQGFAEAQTNLAFRYLLGKGVIQDSVIAHMWFNIAVSNGDEDGAEGRDIAAERMTAAQLAEAQKLARACVARNYKGC